MSSFGSVFVGPKADVIAQMGDKVRARQLAAEAGVPTTPGSAGKLRDAAEAAQLAAQIGYPVLLNTRLKTVFGYTPTYTSAEVFEIYRSAREQQRADKV